METPWLLQALRPVMTPLGVVAGAASLVVILRTVRDLFGERSRSRRDGRYLMDIHRRRST